jgi:hypothetical protein
MTASLAIFTICSNNYLPFARAFFASAQSLHPEADFYLCLADRAPENVTAEPAAWTTVAASQLGMPDIGSLAFSYDVKEFNTSLKPFMFLHLLERLRYGTVLYFDPDIRVYNRLDGPLDALRGGASLVLTPHILRPLETAEAPDDITIMRTGIYNLGFLGVANMLESLEVLRWWGRRVRHHCLDAPEDGLFVDQKFIDLAPAFAPNCQILYDDGLNVAYWNLLQRPVTHSGDTWHAGRDKLVFFHFSGFDPRRPGWLSKYTMRFRSNLTPSMRRLIAEYADQLTEYGFPVENNAAYAYASFESGAPIHAYVRRMFREWTPDWQGDPFRTYEAYAHQAWPDLPAAPPGFLVTNFMVFLWDNVPGLKVAFDLRRPQAVRDFVAWYVLRAPVDLGLDEGMIAPVRRHLAGHGITLADAPRPASVVDTLVSDNDRLLLEGLQQLRHCLAPAGSWREDMLRFVHRIVLARIASRSTAKRAAKAARRNAVAPAGPAQGLGGAVGILAEAPAQPP